MRPVFLRYCAHVGLTTLKSCTATSLQRREIRPWDVWIGKHYPTLSAISSGDYLRTGVTSISLLAPIPKIILSSASLWARLMPHQGWRRIWGHWWIKTNKCWSTSCAASASIGASVTAQRSKVAAEPTCQRMLLLVVWTISASLKRKNTYILCLRRLGRDIVTRFCTYSSSRIIENQESLSNAQYRTLKWTNYLLHFNY